MSIIYGNKFFIVILQIFFFLRYWFCVVIRERQILANVQAATLSLTDKDMQRK